jgi:DNA-binding MarR family transcriptional regulator
LIQFKRYHCLTAALAETISNLVLKLVYLFRSIEEISRSGLGLRGTMTKHSPELDGGRLAKLSDEVSRIGAALAQLSLRQEKPVENKASGTPLDVSRETVAWVIKARRMRERFLPQDLFADPAWDVLLDLFQAELSRFPISVSAVCHGAGAPPTTALRYIRTMTEQGLIIRRPDPFDGRRVFLELSPETSAALRRYFADVIETRQAA